MNELLQKYGKEKPTRTKAKKVAGEGNNNIFRTSLIEEILSLNMNRIQLEIINACNPKTQLLLMNSDNDELGYHFPQNQLVCPTLQPLN
jgi:hypothetical protein